MPATARGIWAQLGLEGEPHGAWATELVWGGLEPGTQTKPSAEGLFPRIDAPA